VVAARSSACWLALGTAVLDGLELRGGQKRVHARPRLLAKLLDLLVALLRGQR